MKRLESRVLWGIVLILVGIIFLVENLGLIHLSDLFWGALFWDLGRVLLRFFYSESNQLVGARSRAYSDQLWFTCFFELDRASIG